MPAARSSCRDPFANHHVYQSRGDAFHRQHVHRGVQRGRRFGHSLFAEAFNLAVERKARRIYLSTTPFLFSAIRLYESLGFRRTGEPPDDLFGTPVLTMAKQLVR